MDRAEHTAAPSAGEGGAATTAPHDVLALREAVVAALQTVHDPEIPVNIYELGLIYRCDVDATGKVAIEMTLTAPGCPVAGTMPGIVQQAVAAVDGVSNVTVELVWDPPWDRSMMSEAAQLELGMY